LRPDPNGTGARPTPLFRAVSPMPQAAAPPKPRFIDDPLEGGEHPEVRGLSPPTDANGSAVRLVAVGARGRGTPLRVGSLGRALAVCGHRFISSLRTMNIPKSLSRVGFRVDRKKGGWQSKSHKHGDRPESNSG